jgi:hypothetical protein
MDNNYRAIEKHGLGQGKSFNYNDTVTAGCIPPAPTGNRNWIKENSAVCEITAYD